MLDVDRAPIEITGLLPCQRGLDVDGAQFRGQCAIARPARQEYSVVKL
jgi:hypothetical protein